MIDERRLDSLERRRTAARVLVVDDDDVLRALIVRALRRDGYDVLEASSACEAVSVIDETTRHDWSSRAIDLVLCDVSMAGMSGLDLGEMLRDARWGMPVIFITAYSEESVTARAARIGATVLEKPFSLEILRRSVLTMIAAGR